MAVQKKRFHFTGEDKIEQEESSFSCSHANAICTSQNSLLVTREKELVSVWLVVYPSVNMVTLHICIAFCPFKAASCFISTAFLLNVQQEHSTHFTDERMQGQDVDLLKVPSQGRLWQDVRSLWKKGKRIFSFPNFSHASFLGIKDHFRQMLKESLLLIKSFFHFSTDRKSVV